MYHRNILWRLRAGQHAVLLVLAGVLFSSMAFAETREQPLVLKAAVSQALMQNPALQVFTFKLDGLEGKYLTADQNPALEMAFEAENMLGSGAFNAFDEAEYTLSLSSVIELGGKRQARTQALAGRYALVEAEHRAEALALLGNVTRGFITALALQEKLQLAADAVALAESTYNIVERRAEQGATHQAEVLRARAELTRSRLEQGRLRSVFDSSRMALAALLGKSSADFHRLQGDLFTFKTPDSFTRLFERARDNPDIRVFASQQRLREAELALARSQSRSDMRWQLGARYLEGTGDSALVAGVSIPLFSASRNQGDIQAAQAARNQVGLRRESALLELRARLYEAYRVHQEATATVVTMRDQELPDRREALKLTRTAYEQGRYSYLELMTAQRELLAAQRYLVDAATTALLNQALIEQLTGQSLAATNRSSDH